MRRELVVVVGAALVVDGTADSSERIVIGALAVWGDEVCRERDRRDGRKQRGESGERRGGSISRQHDIQRHRDAGTTVLFGDLQARGGAP